MDTSEYLPLFIAECRENLDELTNAIVRLEADASDRETLDAIFRIAHSLKGMSGTMGFGQMAKLTHQMEDVLELTRQRGSGLPHEAADVLLECLDLLTGAVDGIEANGEEEIDARELIERLAVLVRDGDEPREAAAPPVSEAPPAGGVQVTLESAALMPSVRAFQVLSVMNELSEVRSSSPALDEVDLFTGTEIVADIVCSDPEGLALALRRVTDVADVKVADTSLPEEPAVAPGPQLKAVAAPRESDASRDAKEHSSVAATVRVDADRLDQMMHLLGETVAKRTQVEELIGDLDVPDLQHAMHELKRASRELQGMVMRVRMIPIETVFMRFPRLVRDVASKLDKKVDLKVVGQDTELDRTVVDAIGDPLVHLIRNALDHGIETPAERVAAGKPEVATLTIAARHKGDSILIAVTDDGRGVDPVAVARRATERGLITADEAASIDLPTAIELLFTPGLSTSDDVGDLSGRGVGMDAVRNRVRKLDGEVIISSTPGEGTVAEIRLPLTLAIVQALLVEVGGSAYGLQMARVQRTLRLDGLPIRSVGGEPILMLEEEPVPLVRAAEVFGHTDSDAVDTHVVVVSAHSGSVALAVPGLIGQRELVTRPLPPALAGSKMLSGAAVLASGDIVLLADCDSFGARPTKQADASIEAA